MPNDRENHAKFQNAFADFVATKTYLFDHGNPFIPLEEYIKHFGMQARGFFTRFTPPYGYSLDFLDQFKDRIVWTNSIAQPDGSRAFLTLIQISPEEHVVAHLQYDGFNERMAAWVEVWAINPQNISKFIKEQEKFRIKLSGQAVGFFDRAPRI